MLETPAPVVVPLKGGPESDDEGYERERRALADLLADPSLVDTLAPEEVPLVLLPLHALYQALQFALTHRLLWHAAHRSPPEPGAARADGDHHADRLLTPAEAAARLGVTEKWLYRHVRQLPFARRLGRRSLRFSEAGLRRWVERHRIPPASS